MSRMASDMAVLLTVPCSVIRSVADAARSLVNVSAVSAGLPDRMPITLAMVASCADCTWRSSRSGFLAPGQSPYRFGSSSWTTLPSTTVSTERSERIMSSGTRFGSK